LFYHLGGGFFPAGALGVAGRLPIFVARYTRLLVGPLEVAQALRYRERFFFEPEQNR
jgi:hypothetical protein